jgi:hypothetical protein
MCASGADIALRFRREQGFYAEAILISEQNVEIARRVYEILAERGVNERAVLAVIEAGLVEPDAELDFRPAYPGVGGGSGLEVVGSFAHLGTIRGNRLVRIEVYTDRSKALAAAGLRE